MIKLISTPYLTYWKYLSLLKLIYFLFYDSIKLRCREKFICCKWMTWNDTFFNNFEPFWWRIVFGNESARINITSFVLYWHKIDIAVKINVLDELFGFFAHKYVLLFKRDNGQKVDESNSLQKGLLYKYSQMLMKVWQICRKCLYCSHSVYTIKFVISHIHTHKLQNVTHGWLRNLVSWR